MVFFPPVQIYGLIGVFKVICIVEINDMMRGCVGFVCKGACILTFYTIAISVKSSNYFTGKRGWVFGHLILRQTFLFPSEVTCLEHHYMTFSE